MTEPAPTPTGTYWRDQYEALHAKGYRGGAFADLDTDHGVTWQWWAVEFHGRLLDLRDPDNWGLYDDAAHMQADIDAGRRDLNDWVSLLGTWVQRVLLGVLEEGSLRGVDLRPSTACLVEDLDDWQNGARIGPAGGTRSDVAPHPDPGEDHP